MDKYIGHELEMYVKASQAKFLGEAEQERLARLVKPPQTNKTLPALRRYWGKTSYQSRPVALRPRRDPGCLVPPGAG
jgi:hypothetical protein